MKNEKLARPQVKEKNKIFSSPNPPHPNSDKVPALRFPEFKDQWTLEKNKNIIQRISDPVSVQPNTYYKQIGIRSHGRGIFHKEEVDGNSLGNKRVFWVKENSFITNIVFAWEQAVAVTGPEEKGMIASHRFPMYQPIENKSDVNYLLHFFLTKKGKSLLELASPGGAGRNKTLGQKEFENLSFAIPSIKEQQKIASFLSSIDERLQQLQQQQSLLEQYKKGCMQQLFSQKLRFKDDKGRSYPDWEEKTIGDVLEIGNGKDYKHLKKGTVPVYGTGGLMTYVDSFLNDGETVCIGRKGTINKPYFYSGKIWTVDTLFYTYNFKNILPKFVFYIFNLINWLEYNEASGVPSLSKTTISKVPIIVPSLEEQTLIANFLSAIDEQINTLQQQVAQTQQFKKGLLQQLFV